MEGRERILIIDDEEIVRRTTSMILERQGYEVLGAKDGYEGLEVVREGKERIDLVLLDLSLPGMSGEEMLAELREADPRMKVVIFTGYAMAPEDFPEADGVIQKPFTMEELARQVRAFLDREEREANRAGGREQADP